MATYKDADTEPNLTECPVCHDLYTVPKLLPCSHILCRDCLITWLQTQEQAGCPLCRCAIVDPNKDERMSMEEVADGFPTDLAMTAMVEAETLLSKQHVCCVCDDMAAVALCLQCGDFFCQYCSNVHKKQAATKQHEVEELSSLTTEKLATHHPATCPDHKDKVCAVYCTSHDASICVVCATTSHRNCPDLVDLRTKISELTSELLQLDEKLAEAVTQSDNVIQTLDKHVQELERDSQTALMELRNVCDRLKAAIDARFESVKRDTLEVGLVSKVTNKKTDFKKSVLQTRSKNVAQKNMTNLYRKFTEHKHFKDMVSIVKDRCKDVGQVQDLPNDLQLNHKLSMSIDDKIVSDIETQISKLGQIKFTTNIVTIKVNKSESSLHTSCYSHGENSCQEPSTKPVNDGVQTKAPVTMTMVQNKDPVRKQRLPDPLPKFDPMTATPSTGVKIKVRSEKDQNEPNISCVVTSLSAEELYLADLKNRSIKVCSLKSGELISTLSLDVEPRGMTLVNCKLLAVTTSRSSILVIDVSDASRPRLQNTIATERPYKGITVWESPVASPMLVVSCGPNSGSPPLVDIITLTGKHVRNLVNTTKLSGLTDPGYLHADTQRDVLYIPDHISDCVFCVQLSTGKQVKQLKHPELSEPGQVCTDGSGNVYVTSGGDGCLLMKSDGNVFQKLTGGVWRVMLTAEEHGRVGGEQPCGVSVTDTALIVSWGAGVVKRYDLI